MPWNPKKYPSNWKTEIRPRIMARAGEVRDAEGNIVKEACCEECGEQNHLSGWRFPSGRWITIHDFNSGYMEPGDEAAAERILKKPSRQIVLTIAHIDNMDPMDCRDENLKALCQRCHLAIDRKYHMKKRKANWLKKKGIQDLFKPNSNNP